MDKNYTWQARTEEWLLACFGKEITNDLTERNHRFLEEALELVQAFGITKSECLQLVDYVFDRPVGEKKQEFGGVMVTLTALGVAANIDVQECGETELNRVWSKIDVIREKQAAKPKHSPLPIEVVSKPAQDGTPEFNTMRIALKCIAALSKDEGSREVARKALPTNTLFSDPNVIDHAAEREIMIQSFAKIEKLFKDRVWIMQGRGNYRSTDEAYQQEVRVIYDEFESIYKDTWKNIQSKTIDYRNSIIDSYKKEQMIS